MVRFADGHVADLTLEEAARTDHKGPVADVDDEGNVLAWRHVCPSGHPVEVEAADLRAAGVDPDVYPAIMWARFCFTCRQEKVAVFSDREKAEAHAREHGGDIWSRLVGRMVAPAGVQYAVTADPELLDDDWTADEDEI